MFYFKDILLLSQKLNEGICYHNLRSSIMVTVASPILPTKTPEGSEDSSIVSVKDSPLGSLVVSLVIEISNVTVVIPA